ncbi:MAG: hypothetical protein LBE89_03245, partial [Helicobacteraceae bacterium]|nr:hypothetical protein [Helicobacteraceae bacterium]
LPLSSKSESISSSIAAAPSNERQSEALRHFRAMRKQAEQIGFLSDDEIEAEIEAARVTVVKQEILN